MRFLWGTLAIILLLGFAPALNVQGYIAIKPSRGWGIFFDTTGDVKIDITDPGVAVRVKVPRPFLEGTTENDTSHVTSDISDDYFYYSVIDQFLHYPYDQNAPFTVEIWNPPQYLFPLCKGAFYNFTAPRLVQLQNLNAPNIAGVYNFTVYIAKKIGSNNRPVFPSLPDKILQVPVSMREDPARISGYIRDDISLRVIKAKGVVYAIDVSTGRTGRGLVNPLTGFFNISGLYAGEYRLEGSASYFSETGYAYAPTTSSTTVRVGKGAGMEVLFDLRRGCIIKGSISYTDQLRNRIRPLDSPYLAALKYRGLNYTVEAYDSKGQIMASKTYESKNLQIEDYTLMIREGATHVGYPAKGTEYAGLGLDTYTVKIWVYGFVLPLTEIRKVTFVNYGVTVNVGMSSLPYGAVLTGKIRLFSPMTNILETPREGEAASFGSLTGKHFGGNILIQAYGGGLLKGLVVLNRTFQNGVVQYADYASGDQTPLMRFAVLGFSEYYNHSYSGLWVVGSSPGPSSWDYGIEAGTYTIRVWIRGYTPGQVKDIVLGAGENTTITVDMVRAGAAQVAVNSWNTRPGTDKPQAPQLWRHSDMCPPPRLRIYFKDSSRLEIGYAESILKPGLPGVSSTTAILNFTGHNWTIDEITSLGYVPTTLNAGGYNLTAYTYGYVQPRGAPIRIQLGSLSRSSLNLIIGVGIHGRVPLMANGLLVGLTENATTRPEVFLESDFRHDNLKGVDVVDGVKGDSTLSFNTYGFYGRGHFFYVDENATRYRDYGLSAETYANYVPVFGYDRKFYQPRSIITSFSELGMEKGIDFRAERMIKISGVVTGETIIGVPPVVGLDWASVRTNGYVTHTFDGDYALHLYPNTGALLTYSIPGYNSQTILVVTNNEATIMVTLTESGAPY